MAPTTDLLQGTLDLLILKTLAIGQKQPEAELENWGCLATAIALVLN